MSPRYLCLCPGGLVALLVPVPPPASLHSFQIKYEKTATEVERDWQQQLAKATKLQEEYLDRINQQQQRLAELTKTELQLRQQALSQSLEQFRKSYDDTFERLNIQVSNDG